MFSKSRIFTGAFLIYSLSVMSALAQDFQREIDTIPVIINQLTLQIPFAGGINRSKPTLADIDNDGDLDLFIGENDGTINFYRNTGTASEPTFTFETEILANIDIGDNSSPAFADIDNDGDMDLFVGEAGGNINFYRNTGSATTPTFTFETVSFANIDIGDNSSPTFADIDNDGDLDLFVGEGGGNINFYRNTGTATEPDYTLETAILANIDIGGDSSPTFADIDNDGDLDLFVGEDGRNINFYRNAGTAVTPVLVLETENLANVNVGTTNAPTFADIDNDGDFDLLVGENDGNINFFRNAGTATQPTFTFELNVRVNIDSGLDSAPTFADIDDDGDLDLFVGERSGNINFYRNTGNPTDPTFALETENLANIDIGSGSMPTLADIDDDGDLDLFIGEDGGNINFYRNTGTAMQAIYTLATQDFANIDVGSFSTPAFVDIDNDGDLDLFVGEGSGNINFYRNTGTIAEPTFTLETKFLANIDVGSFSTLCFADLDNDGDLDLFVGESGSDGNINFYENTGTASLPVFTFETENFLSISVGDDSAPTFADIDNDGDLDLFVGELDGGLHFYRNLDTLPNISLFKTNIDFGPVEVSTQKDENFTIDNIGHGDLIINSIERTSGSLDFTLVSPTAFPITVESSDSLTVTLRFFPTVGGNKDAIFSITSNDIDASPLNIYVTGQAITVPHINISNTNIEFGDIIINMFKDSTVVVRNIGTADLLVNNVDFNIGTNDFSLVSPTSLPITISPNDSMPVVVRFAPSSVGEKSNTLIISNNDPSTPNIVVALRGVGIFPTSVNSPDNDGLPRTFDLIQNYPNPFNPATTISYQLPTTSEVRLGIYNVLGQRIITLVNKVQPAGIYSVLWDGKDESGRQVSSGVYLYQLETKDFVKVRKLILVR